MGSSPTVSTFCSEEATAFKTHTLSRRTGRRRPLAPSLSGSPSCGPASSGPRSQSRPRARRASSCAPSLARIPPALVILAIPVAPSSPTSLLPIISARLASLFLLSARLPPPVALKFGMKARRSLHLPLLVAIQVRLYPLLSPSAPRFSLRSLRVASRGPWPARAISPAAGRATDPASAPF